MNIPVLKNQHYEIPIIDLGSSGEGIGKIDDFTVFVPGGLPGDTVEVRILKVKKNFAFGKLISIIAPSDKRCNALCKIATQCGGCQLQHLEYEEQLRLKTKKVKDVLERIGKLSNVTVNDTIGMEHPFYYRNKAQYPIRKENGEVKIGFFAQKSHRIVPMETCVIQDQRSDLIIQVIKDFLVQYNISIYDEEQHRGLVRHLVIKTAYYTEDIMVCLVINGKELPHSEKLVVMLQKIEGVRSILLNHNKAKTNVILSTEITVLAGNDHIIDKIGDLKFQISLLSFFQVNPLQTKVLYEKALEYADLHGNETVWDAYCGIGTISLFLAQKAKQVYGVEIIEPAVINARENAILNNMENIQYFPGKAEEIIPSMYKDGVIADTIVVDPPRKGCDEALLETLVAMAPNKIVYVSCDPATLARDLSYLTDKGYQVNKVQPVDMFPHTLHIETVVQLTKRI